MKFTAHQYQIAAAQHMLTNPQAALFADPGTGKTAITLMVLSVLKSKGWLKSPVLVTSPLRITTIVWPDEIAKWDQFGHLTYRVLHGRKKADRAAEAADIHLINNEGLAWADKTGILGSYSTLIIDEISKFKSWNSGRTKILKKWLPQFTRRYGLTGTPTPKSMLDLFSEMYLVDGGQSLGRYITHYRNEYFVDRGWGTYPDWQLREGAESKIYDRIAPWCYRLDGQELLDMPPLVCNDIQVDIPKEYKKKSIEALVEMGHDVFSGAQAYMMSRRFAGGVVDGQVVHDAKIKALQDIIDELNGKPVMSGYYYRDEGDMLKERFGCPCIDGRTSTAETADIVARWNRREIPILGVQPAAMGHGLNMQQGGNDFVWYSLTDNQDDYYQTIRRIYRQGVKGAVRVHRLIARGTVDAAMVRALESKTDAQAALLDAIKEMTR